jgi:hypothetical protein
MFGIGQWVGMEQQDRDILHDIRIFKFPNPGKMKQYTLLILNTLTLAGALVMNFLSGTGFFDGRTVGEISARNDTLFTPAGYAFGIWGLIYLFLLAFVAYQWHAWIKRREDRELKQTGIWFMLSNLFNGSWIYFWLHEHIGISVIIILLLLLSLIVLTVRLKLEIWDAPVRIIALVWWPICIYLGWVIVATVANIAIYLKSIDWTMLGISEVTWAIVMLIIAAMIYIFLIFKRNLREAAGVGIWAFVAIVVKQWDANREIAVTAIVLSAILFLLIAYHGYKNRDTSPFRKIQRGEI